jgi:hypothetical protein
MASRGRRPREIYQQMVTTFRPHVGGPRHGEPAQKFCPIHGLALPLTGVCDDCD